MATVKINGREAGKLLFDTELDISEVATVGLNEFEMKFILSNRNLMGPHHFTGPKRGSVGSTSFQMFGYWKGQKSELYHSYFDVKKFYAE